MPPATTTTSRALGRVERPRACRTGRARRARRPAAAAQIAARDRADGADVCTSAPAAGIAADRDRHLADAERVEHRELARGERLERARRRGSSSSVHVSRGLLAPRARPGTAPGTIAPRQRLSRRGRGHRRRAAAAGSPAGARRCTAAKPLHQLVAERVVGVALAAQAGAVEARSRATALERARVEAPAVGREQPRPAEHVAAVQRLDRHRAALRARRSRARPCRGGSTKNASAGSPSRSSVLAGARTRAFARAAGDQLAGGRGASPRSTRSSSSSSSIVLHRTLLRRADRRRLLGDVDADRAPGDAAPAADAAEVPNWSIQVASLWVIHWR